VAAGVVAAACRSAGARLLHVSTDYVFDGRASSPYAEGATVGPRSAYGKTKLAGERAVLAEGGTVVRTAWLYGAGGRSFVATMVGLARGGDGPVDVVVDQVGQPTWTGDLAAGLVALGGAPAGAVPGGIYHATNSGQTSWFGLAKAVFAGLGADVARVRPTSTEMFPRPAPRPAYSVLGNGRWLAAGLPPLRPWEDALADGLRDVVG
jgi:dTDP-4-dehydrorhamnose reductase